MKKQLLTVFGILFFSLNSFAAHYYIFNIGDTYNTPTLQVNLGDTVTFATSTAHTTQEVSFATWTANDTTHLAGGFDGVPGSSMFIATTLGDIYYVCIEHVQMNGMKGMIKVSQVGIETNKPMNFQILQSLSEQYIELKVTGGSACEMHVEMLNLSGQTVRKMIMDLNGDETSTIIEIGDLPKGVYMIRWSYGQVNKARKIILQ